MLYVRSLFGINSLLEYRVLHPLQQELGICKQVNYCVWLSNLLWAMKTQIMVFDSLKQLSCLHEPCQYLGLCLLEL